ncbi:MAG: polyprenyl synthetase family protein [Frankiaceae bacterium]
MNLVDPLDRADLRARVTKALDAFVGARRPALEAIGDDLVPVADTIAEFVTHGGKRVRPAFCYWAWRAAGGPDADTIVAAAAALELLHACALVHDDVMDRSDRRRGRPAVHRRFATLHRQEGWRGDAEAFGRSAAILLGDLCLAWSDEMLRSSGLPAEALLRAASCYDAMRTEVMAGQYLDIVGQVTAEAPAVDALRIARFKTATYTVQRPLLIGASLAGADDALLTAFSAYGLPLGEAFQLRDDVLGVFGDPAVTGKPAGDDLREGKRTVLVVTALRQAGRGAAARVRSGLGDPGLDEGELATMREIIAGTGALDHVERLIAELTDRALGALAAAPIGREATEATEALAELAVAATRRAA